MMVMEKDANQIIDALGGTSKVARIFEISTAAVAQWRKNGIPKYPMREIKRDHPELFGLPVKARKRQKSAAVSAP